MAPSAFAVASVTRATAAGIGDVQFVRHRVPAQSRARFLERGGVAVPQRDARAARHQALRDRQADAGCTAGDCRGAAIEVQLIHVFVPGWMAKS